MLELTTELFGLSKGIDRWIVLTANDEPDTFWYLEIFDDKKAIEHHGQNQTAEAGHEKVLDLLAEPPLHVAVHSVAANWTYG